MKMRMVLLFMALALAANAGIELVKPVGGVTVPLIKEPQKKFMDLAVDVRRKNMTDAVWRKALKADTGWTPMKVDFEWKGGDEGVKYVIGVRRLPDGKVFYRGKTKKTKISLENFEIARTYEWTVSDGKDMVKGTFRTEDRAPRMVHLEGVPNMRDLGGRIGLGGCRVKQGLVYRSAGLNNNANSYYTQEEIMNMYKSGTLVDSVPEMSRKEAKAIVADLDAGKKADTKHLVKKWYPGAARLNDTTRAFAKKEFGIKTDLDLRTARECYGMSGSPLGPDVKWAHVPSSAYGGMQDKGGKDAFKECFKVFLDEKNYPIVFHCIAGADRTGSLAYILNALLGVDDAELLLDWEVTAFQNSNHKFAHASRYDKLVEGFLKFPGANTTEKVAEYVKSLGFTDADIARFRDIMLEK